MHLVLKVYGDGCQSVVDGGNHFLQSFSTGGGKWIQGQRKKMKKKDVQLGFHGWKVRELFNILDWMGANPEPFLAISAPYRHTNAGTQTTPVLAFSCDIDVKRRKAQSKPIFCQFLQFDVLYARNTFIAFLADHFSTFFLHYFQI